VNNEFEIMQKRSWLNLRLYLGIFRENWGNQRKPSIRRAYIRAEIWTRDMINSLCNYYAVVKWTKAHTNGEYERIDNLQNSGFGNIIQDELQSADGREKRSLRGYPGAGSPEPKPKTSNPFFVTHRTPLRGHTQKKTNKSEPVLNTGEQTSI
jgi:hypothetical protein